MFAIKWLFTSWALKLFPYVCEFLLLGQKGYFIWYYLLEIVDVPVAVVLFIFSVHLYLVNISLLWGVVDSEGMLPLFISSSREYVYQLLVCLLSLLCLEEGLMFNNFLVELVFVLVLSG
jgi:hypothetical protein